MGDVRWAAQKWTGHGKMRQSQCCRPHTCAAAGKPTFPPLPTLLPAFPRHSRGFGPAVLAPQAVLFQSHKPEPNSIVGVP